MDPAPDPGVDREAVDDVRQYLASTAALRHTGEGLPADPQERADALAAGTVRLGPDPDRGWDAHGLLLTHGWAPPPGPLPPRMTRGPMRGCYDNAWRRSSRSPHLEYMEGIAVRHSLGVPVLHAWLLDRRTGTAVDPTWTNPPGEVTYLGLVIPDDVVREARARSRRVRVTAILDGEYARGGWFLREAWPRAVAATERAAAGG